MSTDGDEYSGDSSEIPSSGDSSSEPAVGQPIEQQAAPDYLVGSYKDAESQARAYHELHNRYQGQHTQYADYAYQISQRYQSDPEFRARYDALWSQQQAPTQQQENIFFDPKDEEAREKWWDPVIKDPGKNFAPLVQKLAREATQREVQQLQQQMRQMHANMVYQQYQPQIQAMQNHPYGQQLLQSVQQGQMGVPQAVQLFQAAQAHFAAQQEQQGNGQPPRQTAPRGPDGKFARAGQSGRRSGSEPERVPKTQQEQRALVRAKYRLTG